MPSKRKPAAKKSAKSPKAKTRKPAAKRKTRRRPSGPLVDVARKIGATLGEVAVRTGIVKPASSEPGSNETGGE